MFDPDKSLKKMINLDMFVYKLSKLSDNELTDLYAREHNKYDSGLLNNIEEEKLNKIVLEINRRTR